MRILLALRPSSTGSLHRFASSQCTLRLNFLASNFFKQTTLKFGLAIGIWAQNFTMAIMCYSIGSAIVIFTKLLWFWSMVTEYEKGIQE